MAAQCRTCRAPIRWVRMRKSGKNNPLDATPVPNGNIVIVGRHPGDGKEEACGLGEVPDPPGAVPRYVSHFSTCPQRQQHRRPDGRAPLSRVTAHCPKCRTTYAGIIVDGAGVPQARCGDCLVRTNETVPLVAGDPN